MTALAHIAGVVAVWTLLLFGLRFVVDGCGWLRPLSAELVRMIGGKRGGLRAVVDQLHVDLVAAIVSPWSATLLFGGAALIGLGYAAGAIGDVARLVSAEPRAWDLFDVVSDCVAAILAVTGMSCVLAATSDQRRASFGVSLILVLTGVGIGWVTF